MFDHPLFRLFFDVTVNGGWNLIAYLTYTLIIGTLVLIILEKKGK